MALDQEVLSKLLEHLELMVDQLEEKKSNKEITVAKLDEDYDLLFSVEHRLHTAIEAVVNISEHIVAGMSLGHKEASKDTIKTLAEHKIIPKELAERLGDASDMRNILIHHYADINLQKLVSAVTNDLNDLRAFAKATNEFLEKQVTSKS